MTTDQPGYITAVNRTDSGVWTTGPVGPGIDFDEAFEAVEHAYGGPTDWAGVYVYEAD
jgi:hypothetical protein